MKYRQEAQLGARSGLSIYCRDEAVTHAYWVTRQERDFRVGQVPQSTTPVLVIPAHIFCYLLGQAERLLWQE